MFSESAAFYDLIYSGFKDYRAEAEQIAGLLARVSPGARTVLDAGCGTGEHARILADEFGLRVDGLDISPEFIDLARRKNPGGRFFQGDMASFDLERTYDVVLSLFSSIAYLQTPERITAALKCFDRHLAPGGIVIVEPWFTPEAWTPGRLTTRSASRDGVEIVRMSHAASRDRLSILAFDYLIGTPSGVEHRRELHELGLLTRGEMLRCFTSAGLVAEFDPAGLIGRGLYVAGSVRATVAADTTRRR